MSDKNIVDFNDSKIVIVGASSGIGRETAITLSKLGATVIAVARRKEELDATLELLEGDGHRSFVMDAADVNGIEGVIKGIVGEIGPVDGLVYAAGISKSRPLSQLKPDALQETFSVNFFGFMETVRQLCKKGRFNPGMRIVAISSIAALRGDSAHTAYSASKAAIDGAVRCLAMELADKGICINTVAPAMTNTVMYENFIGKFGEDSESNRKLMRRQYLGIARTQDVANAITFLLSPAARFITGICMPVDGGYTSN